MGKPVYDEDFVAWTQGQAEALRAAPRVHNALDYDQLAEEIADLGKRDLRELLSGLEVLCEHLIKLDGAPDAQPAAHWARTVRDQRREIARLLDESPSLRAKLDEPPKPGAPTRLDQVLHSPAGTKPAAACGRKMASRRRSCRTHRTGRWTN